MDDTWISPNEHFKSPWEIVIPEGMIISIGVPPRIESVFGEKSKIGLLQSVPFQPESHLHSRLLKSFKKQYPLTHPQFDNWEQSLPSYPSSQRQYGIGREFKFGSVNKHLPWPEQSFNDEQFGGSQLPVEFLASPSAHSLLHSPVLRLPIIYSFIIIIIIINHELMRRKKKKKENHQDWEL